jgi:Cu2+-exporting ATPase
MEKGKKKYSCPMKCEGDKTYDQPGNCPVCNMHLVEQTDSD